MDEEGWQPLISLGWSDKEEYQKAAAASFANLRMRGLQAAACIREGGLRCLLHLLQVRGRVPSLFVRFDICYWFCVDTCICAAWCEPGREAFGMRRNYTHVQRQNGRQAHDRVREFACLRIIQCRDSTSSCLQIQGHSCSRQSRR